MTRPQKSAQTASIADNLPEALPEILPLQPYLREIIWGGRRLQRFGKQLPPDIPIGESFEVSALPEQDSVVRCGELAGLGLRDVLSHYGEKLVGSAVVARYQDDFPLLIKLIDAQDDLSLQVHPDDAYARSEGLGTFGKTEAWFVLHSDGARLALGLPQGTDAARLQEALTDGRAEDAVLYQDVEVNDVVAAVIEHEESLEEESDGRGAAQRLREELAELRTRISSVMRGIGGWVGAPTADQRSTIEFCRSAMIELSERWEAMR